MGKYKEAFIGLSKIMYSHIKCRVAFVVTFFTSGLVTLGFLMILSETEGDKAPGWFAFLVGVAVLSIPWSVYTKVDREKYNKPDK